MWPNQLIKQTCIPANYQCDQPCFFTFGGPFVTDVNLHISALSVTRTWISHPFVGKLLALCVGLPKAAYIKNTSKCQPLRDKETPTNLRFDTAFCAGFRRLV